MSKISDKEIADAIESLKYKKEYSGIAREALIVLEAAQEEISKLQGAKEAIFENREKWRESHMQIELENAQLREANTAMLEVLKWYAHKPRYSSASTDPDYPYQRTPEVYDDGGQRARQVLADIEKGAES